MLEVIASYEVGNRPNRVEPRVVKRRPKPHRFVNDPRQQARDRLLILGAAGSGTNCRRQCVGVNC